MKRLTRVFPSVSFLMICWIGGFSSCSVFKTNPDKKEESPQDATASATATSSSPALTAAPHPAGNDIGDVTQLFLEKNSPDASTYKGCDADFKKLLTLTQSRDETEQGAKELVRTDPMLYHWCFYSKILELESRLKTDVYIDEKQTHVLEAYSFLVPVARGFLSEYRDSRYLRWAVAHYRKFSEWVFFRRLELTQDMTSVLVEATNPFENWRAPAAKTPILDKYKLIHPSTAPVVEAGPAHSAIPVVPPVVPADQAIDPTNLPDPGSK